MPRILLNTLAAKTSQEFSPKGSPPEIKHRSYAPVSYDCLWKRLTGLSIEYFPII